MDELDQAGQTSVVNEGANNTPANTPGQSAPTGGNEGTPPGGTAPAQTNAQQTPAPGSVPGQQTSGQQAPQVGNGGGQQSGGQPATDWQSARDFYERALGRQGVTQQFADDEAFLRHLAERDAAAAQLQAQLQLASQREQVLMQQALAAQQARQAAQPAPAEKPKWFNPPEYNPAWERVITKDANGNLVVPPGHDPTILAKYTAYHDFRRNWAEKLFTDPEGTLSPFVEDRAAALAERAVQKHLSSYQERVQADTFVRDNASWLQVRDPQGQAVIDPRTGRPQLSQLGQTFLGHLRSAIGAGVSGFDAQVQYAQGMTQRDALADYYRQAQATQQGNQARQSLLQAANRRPNQTGSENAGNPNAPAPQNPGLSFRDQLTAAMAAAGISDADIQAEPAPR